MKSLRNSGNRSLCLVAIALGAAGTVAIAGCGSSSDDATGASGSNSASVTIEHQWGRTAVPANPKRVVALGWNDADTVIALGVNPVAIVDWQQVGLKNGESNPWASLDGTTKAGHTDGPEVLPRGDLDFRKIAALKPDLILAVNGRANSSKSNYEMLSKIAPTVGSPKNTVNNNLPWQDQVRVDAKALGRVNAGEDLIKNTTAHLAKAKDDNPDLHGKTFTVNWAVQNGWHSYTEGDVRSQTLTDVGMLIAPSVAQLPATNYYADLSIERTPAIDADVVLLVAFARDAKSVMAEPAVQNLAAVKDKRYVLLDNAVDPTLRAAYATGSTSSIDYTLDYLIPRLKQAAAGRGA